MQVSAMASDRFEDRLKSVSRFRVVRLQLEGAEERGSRIRVPVGMAERPPQLGEARRRAWLRVDEPLGVCNGFAHSSSIWDPLVRERVESAVVSPYMQGRSSVALNVPGAQPSAT